MTATPIAPTRTRLRERIKRRAAQPDTREWGSPAVSAAEDRQIMAEMATLHRPYTHHWVYSQADGLWTLVVRVTATGQTIPISYRIVDAPDVVDAEVVAARLYGLRRWEGA